MAAQIHYDLLRGLGAQTGLNAESVSRPFRIDGLESGPDAIALMHEAYGVIPDKGTLVPAPMAGLVLDNADIQQIWQTPGSSPARWECLGVIVYRSPTIVAPGITTPDKNGPGVTISTTTSVEEYESDIDADGNQITTAYDGVVQAHRTRRLRHLTTHVFARPEEEYPRSRKDTIEGRVNLGAWNGYADGTVLCQYINARSRDNVVRLVEYTFVVRSDGWTERFVHEDPLYPGQPLPIASLSAPELAAAVTVAERFQKVSFAGLNITLATST